MLLKTAPSGLRRRAVSAAAAFSGSLAALCLTAALASRALAPLCGCIAAAIAAAALLREARRAPAEALALQLGSDGTVRASGDEDAPAWRPVGVTRNLICLAGHGRSGLALWRDSLDPDGFRRIAAYGLWRRSVADRSPGFELIASNAVTGGPSAARTGRPRGR